jgi:hypothetical protein
MTTQATHTPGPWYVLGDYVSSKSGGEVVCPIKRIRAEDLSLIAAAPDLLEALRGLIDQLEAAGIHIPGEDSGQWHGAEGISFSRAIEAIAKAEGRAE